MLYWTLNQTLTFIRYSSIPTVHSIVQERCNSNANALELHLSCTNPSMHLLHSGLCLVVVWSSFMTMSFGMNSLVLTMSFRMDSLVQCRYNMAKFPTNNNRTCPIAHPLGLGMGVFYGSSIWLICCLISWVILALDCAGASMQFFPVPWKQSSNIPINNCHESTKSWSTTEFFLLSSKMYFEYMWKGSSKDMYIMINEF